MPYTTNGDVRICYEATGHGPAVMLAHGGTSSMESWQEGPYIERLADAYTVIVYDARGHGQSDRPHTHEAYDLHHMASDAVAVLDALSVERTHFWGYSMGGWTALQLARQAPQRLRSLILGGTGPLDDPEPPDASAGPLLRVMRAGVAQGPDAVVKGVRELFGAISPQYEGRLRRLDYQAMVALMEHATYHRTNQQAILPTITVPCLVYMAESDDPGFVETQAWMRAIPNATFIPIGGTHVSGDPEAEIGHVRQFLDRIAA